jgi:DNA polymerase elongation subunit (family B)
MSSPRILLIDIETRPGSGYSWGLWEQNIIEQIEPWSLLCFAYKELGEKKVHCLSRLDFKDKTEKSLVKAAWEVLNSADVIIGHNLDSFDNRKLKAKFVEYGLKPPKPYKTIDTKKIAKSQFAFDSNSLNYLGEILGLGKKLETGGWSLWRRVMKGELKAWKEMIAYNKQDVILLEKVYEVLKPWHPNHPNLALYEGRPGCPVCKTPRVQRRGVQVLRASINARFQCQGRECGHWFSRKLPK